MTDNNQYVIGQPDVIAAIVKAIAASPCPDCNADTEQTTDQHGTQHLAVLHDNTCPTYREMNS
ncbi:MAG: hypothetical protein GX610_23670 [Rhodococcus sp.]|nr:hypothetical protein [Rhodococcus sp. (in: high G+C Gram-positive bacteria)]